MNEDEITLAEREAIVRWLYHQADEHFNPRNMMGEFCAQLADQIKTGTHHLWASKAVAHQGRGRIDPDSVPPEQWDE